MSTNQKPATVKYLTPDRDGKPLFVEVAKLTPTSEKESDTYKGR